MSFRVGDKVYRVDRRIVDGVLQDVIESLEVHVADHDWMVLKGGPQGCVSQQGFESTPEAAWERFVGVVRAQAEAAQARLAEVLAMPMPEVEEGL